MGIADSGDNGLRELYRLRVVVFRAFVLLTIVILLLSVAWVSIRMSGISFVACDVETGTIYICPALAEASDGTLYMAYASSAGLVVAVEEDGRWASSVVLESEADGNAFAVKALSVAVDDDGWITIASVVYWLNDVETPAQVICFEDTPSGWRSSVVDDDIGQLSTYGVSIAVDSESRKHIVYSEAGEYWAVVNLTYASNSGGDWDKHNLVERYIYGLCVPSICVDSQDVPYVAYTSESRTGFVVDLSSSPLEETIGYGWGDPCGWDVGSSFSCMVVDDSDTVHVLYFSYELGQDYTMVTGHTLNRFSYKDGVRHYDNISTAETPDLGRAFTDVTTDADGRMRVFYNGWDVVGSATIGDTKIDEETVYLLSREERRALLPGMSAVLRDDGTTVLSKPFGPPGYLTDSVSFVNRLSDATINIHAPLLILAAVLTSLSVGSVLSYRGLKHEREWLEAGEDR